MGSTTRGRKGRCGSRIAGGQKNLLHVAATCIAAFVARENARYRGRDYGEKCGKKKTLTCLERDERGSGIVPMRRLAKNLMPVYPYNMQALLSLFLFLQQTIRTFWILIFFFGFLSK